MSRFTGSWCRRALGVLALLAAGAVPAFCQATLYDNGPDGNIGYYHINFGSAVSDSFVLSQPATITNVVLTLYDVDDRNDPEHIKWKITTGPFGGTVLASGYSSVYLVQLPYLTRFLYFAWQIGFVVPSINLPAGAYYLQIQDVVTRWDTWAFWAQSSGGESQGYYEAVGENGAGKVSLVPSESFSVLGQWQPNAGEVR
jgi:hypothetical protein